MIRAGAAAETLADEIMTLPTDEEIRRSIDEFQNRKIFSSFDLSSLGKIPDDKLEQAIIDYVLLKVGDDFDREVEVVGKLPPGFRAIYTTWGVEAEVNNGGLNQYFWNSEGRLADLAVEGFIRIGAPEYADLLRRAIGTWKNEESEVGYLREEGTLESFSESYEHTALGPLDEEFFKLAEISDLSALRVFYMKSHVHEFVTPE